MDARSDSVLAKIIDYYVDSCEPVGSRVLSKLLKQQISAATIRNVMSDLSEMGLLTQPHTSAGRIPTDLAYRYYVNNLMKIGFEKDKIESQPKATITEHESQPYNLEEVLMEAVRDLSKKTNFAGVVISPQPAVSKLKKIELIRLNQTQVLLILVTQSGLVRNKILYFRESPSQSALTEMGSIFCKVFEGNTVSKARDELVDRLSKETDLQGDMLVQMIRIGKKALDIGEFGELYVFGHANMFLFPEFSENNLLQAMYQVFEEKKALSKTLEEMMDGEGVQLKIGNENHYEGLEQCSVVATTYGNKSYLLGSIGIVGPTRMNYPKVISEINNSSRELTAAVSHFLDC